MFNKTLFYTTFFRNHKFQFSEGTERWCKCTLLQVLSLFLCLSIFIGFSIYNLSLCTYVVNTITKDRITTLKPFISSPETTSFQQFIMEYNWSQISQLHDHSDFIGQLTPYLIREPLITINESCMYPKQVEIVCLQHQGIKRSKPIKIVSMINFAAEVDTLEIHLQELYDVVDHFVIVESIKSHHNLASKILIWDRVKDQSRFQKFHKKILHFIIDDSQINMQDPEINNIWYIEGLQESQRWKMFVHWNNNHGHYYSEEDMISFGDADEISAKQNIEILKQCDIGNRVDIGLWFTFGLLNQAFQSDWPIPGYPFSLGSPTFWSIQRATSYDKVPTRMRGRSEFHLLGGAHLTNNHYLPHILYKINTCTECDTDQSIFNYYSSMAIQGRIKELEMDLPEKIIGGHRSRIVSIDQLDAKTRQSVVKIPWFLECNLERYPYWNGKPDSRLDY